MESAPVPRPLAAQREAAVEQIQTAYVDEVISYDEMAQRLDGVLSAATGDEVLTVVADLPAVAADRALEIHAINGRIDRRGSWRVPRRVRIVSECGSVKLDLSQGAVRVRPGRDRPAAHVWPSADHRAEARRRRPRRSRQ